MADRDDLGEDRERDLFGGTGADVETNGRVDAREVALSEALATLFDGVTEVPELIKAMRWNDLYQLLEDTTDKAETVATVLSNIALKNA